MKLRRDRKQLMPAGPDAVQEDHRRLIAAGVVDVPGAEFLAVGGRQSMPLDSSPIERRRRFGEMGERRMRRQIGERKRAEKPKRSPCRKRFANALHASSASDNIAIREKKQSRGTNHLES